MAHITSTNDTIREMALFAGAGGGILGGKLLGWETICAVEWEPYPTSVLVSRQNEGILSPFPIWDDIQTFDGKPWRGRIDVVSGGFPCQDISIAGKGAGIDGTKSSMWSHMARVISEVQPPVVWVENSPMLIKRGLARVLGDLAEMGYDAKWGIVGAHHAGANHKRDRIWILAYTNSHTSGREDSRVLGEEKNSTRKDQQVDTATGDLRGAGQHEWQHTLHGLAQVTKEPTQLADTEGQRSGELQDKSSKKGSQSSNGVSRVCSGLLRKHKPTTQLAHTNSINEWTFQDWINQHKRHPQWQCSSNSSCVEDTNSERLQEQWLSKSAKPTITKSQRTGWWAIEPSVGRVANGVSSRVDRLKSIGNAQCPQAMALAWHILSADD